MKGTMVLKASIKSRLAEVGVSIPEILLPGGGTPFETFSVIACDQFSADPAYWDEADSIVGGNPSALKLILPEARLKSGADGGEIPETMRRYIEQEKIVSCGETMVFVKRHTTSGVRRGLVVALDLERYEFREGAASLIRSTEQTVRDRLPARIAIRREAPLELPHVLVLVDDPQDKLMLRAERCASIENKLYDFNLMLGGGRIEGYALRDDKSLEDVAAALEQLKETGDGFLFAMGDGNHSFAAAKSYWDEIKCSVPEEEREDHPARYALCEVVNVYDDALGMWPIHRLLINVDADVVQREVGFDASCPLPLEQLQPKLDAWLSGHPEAELEYIHGEDECRELAKEPNRLAIVFPPFDKSSVFRVVREDGSFQRKSFSIGTAKDKRYYLESRMIR